MGHRLSGRIGQRRWKTVEGTRKDADEELAKIVRLVDPLLSTPSASLKNTPPHGLKPTSNLIARNRTYWEYESVIRNHLNPEFGNVPMVKINRTMVEAMVARKVALGLSCSHVRNIIVPLREMFIVLSNDFRHSLIASFAFPLR
jgi:hypothetical protein